MTCSNCGAELPENALLCPYCGYENEAIAEESMRKSLRCCIFRSAWRRGQRAFFFVPCWSSWLWRL